MGITTEQLFTCLQIAFRAGQTIMEIYKLPFEVELKSDNSPLTIADKSAHSIIAAGLSATGIPVLSEEGAQTEFETRNKWEQFWLVDPLDGTKEFVKRNGDFTVNIALIHNSQPIFGVVYAPVPGIMYWGSAAGSYRLAIQGNEKFEFLGYSQVLEKAEQLPLRRLHDGFLVLGSRSHMNAETESFIEQLKKKYPGLSFISRGSSLKFCTLAEGAADIYPRFSPTMEWDTAAGHAVAHFAGCTVVQANNGLPVTYNKPSLLNPNFVAERKKK